MKRLYRRRRKGGKSGSAMVEYAFLLGTMMCAGMTLGHRLGDLVMGIVDSVNRALSAVGR